jgi:hypothetical protein
MNIHLPEPPPESPYLVWPQGNQLMIRRPAHRLDSGRGVLLVFLGLGLLVVLVLVLASLLVGQDRPDPEPIVLAVCVYAIGTWLGWRYLHDAVADTQLAVTADTLSVVVRGLFRTRHWEWTRAEIVAIQAGDGLEVIGTQRNGTFLVRRPLHELRWLRETLCERLQIRDATPTQPGEIEVFYAFSFERGSQEVFELFDLRKTTIVSEFVRGVLQTKPGRLRLYDPAVPGLQYRFYDVRQAGPGLQLLIYLIPLSRPYGYFLSQEDIWCHTSEAGGACVQIKGYPAIALTLWCEEKEAIHRALAQFWGSRED